MATSPVSSKNGDGTIYDGASVWCTNTFQQRAWAYYQYSAWHPLNGFEQYAVVNAHAELCLS
jgi:hypothetical protein